MQKKLKCDFKSAQWNYHDGIIYTCTVENQTIIENVQLEFTGIHEKGKSNFNVVAVIFDKCTCAKIPQGLMKSFPNLKILKIRKSKMMKIERKDLKELSQLEVLSFVSNEIMFLPDDLFADMKHLEVICFVKDNIKIIEPNLLNGLNELRYVDFSSNPFIDMIFDSINKRGNTLEEIKQAIRQKYLKETTAKLKIKYGISSDLNHIIQNDKLKDFTVNVDGEEFKVHKLVLAARSPVFSEMIENNIDAVSLNLDNISTKTFRVILDFIYTDELQTSDDIDFMHLFMTADKLKINKLKEFAAEKLIEKINAENALEMLTLANKYEHEKLRCKSFEQIKNILGYDNIDADYAKKTDLLKEALDYKNKMNAVFNKK